ncbi:MAG TPA: Crp/Fnr family transcriptional regulator [Longimicrobiales bacterium]|nr:Crp/Fnr family transcriptional regulator [Longimicrobiales bacterium]
MHESLIRYISAGMTLSDEHIALVRLLFVPRALTKGQFFQRAGQVASRGAFVVRGCFRTYAIDERGKEQILGFSPEEAWIGDLQSATTGTPTLYFVEAIEPSDVFTIDLPGLERLHASVPVLADAFHKGIQRSRAAKERRILASLHTTAEERYAEFVESKPQLAQRIPLHMLASYLGVTPETLSRIRARRKLR